MLEWQFIHWNHSLLASGLIFLFGILAGSVLNVCIARIPESGSSNIDPWRLSILSWLWGPRRIRPAAVELLTGLLFALAWWQASDPVMAAIGLLFTSILLGASFIDYDTLEIPDRFSVGGMLLGLTIAGLYPALHGEVRGIDSFITALSGAIIGAGIFYWISSLGHIAFQKDAMGEGDVKLAGCIGAFCGWQGAAFILIGGVIAGLLLTPLLLLLSRNKNWTTEDDAADQGEAFAMPFGPALALAAWFYWVGWDFGLLELFYVPR